MVTGQGQLEGKRKDNRGEHGTATGQTQLKEKMKVSLGGSGTATGGRRRIKERYDL
jgi:hypothetical protein